MSNKAVVYKTASNFEGKACRELAQLGINAVAPWDESGKRAKITAPGYVFAHKVAHAAFLKHVQSKPLGFARISDIANLYVMKPAPRPEPEQITFGVGEPVYVADGPFSDRIGIVIKACRKGWVVEVGNLRVSMATHSLRKHDPG